MEQRSHIVPIILGVLIILAIIGGVIYVSTNTTVVTHEEEPETTTSPENQPAKNNTYHYGDITFTYPKDWTVEENMYYTPAGAGGVVGATFTHPRLTSEEDTITIGGRQVSCYTLLSIEEVTCMTVADLPIYTTSKNPEILHVFDSMVKTVAISRSEWITWSNPVKRYTIDFHRSMLDKGDTDYPAAPGLGYKADVFEFPETTFEGSTYSAASVSVLTTKTNCTVMPGQEQVVPAMSVKNIHGIQFEYREFIGAATSNRYTTYEYSTSQNELCYHISLFTHHTEPSVHAEDVSEIKVLENKNKEVANTLENIFNSMLSTFEFIE
jgi:hypothetical protein